MIRGFFVSFSFIGWGILGNKKGVFFRIYFNVMFKKIGIRLGWFKCFMELFRIFLVWVIVSLLFIIFIWLFICNCRLGVVIRFIFEWFIWVMFVLKLFLIFSWVNVLLFNLGLVIRIFLEISCLFWKFYFIFICFLKKIVIVFIFIGLVIIRILLCMWNIVVEFISFVCLFLL